MDGSILRIMRSRSVIQAGSGSAAFAATLPPGTIQMGAVQPLPPSQSGTAGLSLLVEGFGEEVWDMGYEIAVGKGEGGWHGVRSKDGLENCLLLFFLENNCMVLP